MATNEKKKMMNKIRKVFHIGRKDIVSREIHLTKDILKSNNLVRKKFYLSYKLN